MTENTEMITYVVDQTVVHNPWVFYNYFLSYLQMNNKRIIRHSLYLYDHNEKVK